MVTTASFALTLPRFGLAILDACGLVSLAPVRRRWMFVRGGHAIASALVSAFVVAPAGETEIARDGGRSSENTSRRPRHRAGDRGARRGQTGADARRPREGLGCRPEPCRRREEAMT